MPTIVKIFIFLLFGVLSLKASILTIDNKFISGSSSEFQFNVEDKNGILNNDNIILNNNLQEYTQNHASYSNSIFWSRFKLQNKETQAIALVLSNPRAGMDKIDVFVYEGNTLVKKHNLGDLRPQNERLLLSSKSVFYLNLEPNKIFTIVTRYENLGSYDFNWEILSTLHYSSSNSRHLWFWGIFGGIMIALIFYNLVMYIYLKKAVFLFFVIHSILLLWFQYAFNGILYFLNIGINLLTITFSTWFVSNLIVSVLSIFTILFFDFYRTNKKIFILLCFLSGMNFIIFLIYLYAYIDSSILVNTNYFIISGLLSLFIYLFIAVYSVYKRYVGAWYYLLGEGTYVLSLIYLTVIFSGQTTSGALIYAIPTAILIEASMFSLALGSRVKAIRYERDNANDMILSEARFTVIGKNIGMAVHQWKEPLSQLSSHITYLQALAFNDSKTEFSQEVKDHIEAMSEMTEYMKETINDVYNSCTNINEISLFNLYETIDITLRFQRDRIITKNIEVQVNVDKNIYINGYKNALINTLMILCDNTLNQFEKNQIPKKTILFECITHNDSFILRIQDNAGGIKNSTSSNIFEMDTSEKSSKGIGIGLALAKMLVEKRLNGTINGFNSQDGVCFEIVLLNKN